MNRRRFLLTSLAGASLEGAMTERAVFSFAGWTLFLYCIWFLFDKSESVASPEFKVRITRWLKGVEPRRASNWPSTFAQMFDHVFGSRHLTWRCFWRSCLASLAAVAILLLLWWALYPKDVYAFLAGKAPISDMLISPIVPTIPFFIMILVANFIPDYISLVATRAILRWMNRQQSLLAVCALSALGLIASVAIVVVSAPVAWQLTVAIYFGPTILSASTSYWANLLHSVQRGAVNLPGQLRDGLIYELFSLRVGDCLAVCVPWGIWTYASLFTSVWLWLYGAAGVAVRLLYYVGGTVTWLREFFDFDAKPITSIGWVAMVLVTIVYWGGALVVALW